MSEKKCVCGHEMESGGYQVLELHGESLLKDYMDVELWVCPRCGRIAFFMREKDRKDRYRAECGGKTDEELSALFAANGFTDYRSELRALVDIHDNADSLLRWSEASAFGNFLEAFSPAERSLVRQAFARLVEDKRTPEGLSLERYLRFAFVRKAPTAN